MWLLYELQQYLPFTVLKLNNPNNVSLCLFHVAAVPTVYGIETQLQFVPMYNSFRQVATVPTIYGIETLVGLTPTVHQALSCNSTYRLRYWNVA